MLLGWFGIDDAYTLITGKDILNGEKSSRLQAAIWLAISRIPGSSLLKGAGKGGKVAKEVDAVHDAAKAVDGLEDASKAEKELKLAKKERKQNTLRGNKICGRLFEKEQFAIFSKYCSDAQEQITIITKNNIRFRIDVIGHHDETGELILQEYKSSKTARLTENQKYGFEDLRLYGGEVVGKGKGKFTKGFEILPGTRVKEVRPIE